MSDVERGSSSPEAAEQVPPGPVVPGVDKNELAAKVISEILRLMDLPGRLELKDASDGGISVALFLEGQVPGVQAGRRSHLIDALQFIANKIVNRPQTERRWISIGVGGHPEPRPPPGAPRAPSPAAAAPSVPGVARNGSAPQVARPPRPSAPPVAAAMPLPRDPLPRHRPPQPSRPNGQAQPSGPRAAAPPRPAAVPVVDETTLEVPEDAALTQAARALAEKSAKLGRFFAIAPMKQEDRARLLKAARGVAGTAVKVEGEGRNRRVVFVPDNPTPMPKRAIVDYGDDDEDDVDD